MNPNYSKTRCHISTRASLGSLRFLAAGVFLFFGMVQEAGADVLGLEKSVAEQRAQEFETQHSVYLGLLGKGGMYSLGYQYHWRARFALGVAVSAFRIDFETLMTVVPYLFWTPIERGNHALFFDMGTVLSRHDSESPAKRLPDAINYGVGAELSLGYQYLAGRFVVRPYVMAQYTRCASGWVGIDLGVRFR